ncbi:hypothetical protein AB1Y20_014640 [Prymnesium parvum]|uniref:Ycf49-like protein n=1 Tax=Prymnesium parvum TaxID=97485 RepID=A0AB34IDQ0_PRYPA
MVLLPLSPSPSGLRPALRPPPPSATMLAPELSSLQPPLLSPSLLSADSAFSSTADELAGSLFGASLFPWLAMLYWMKHPTVRAPPGVSFGLTFLLAFVFASIPAAVAAGLLYGASLADADWLHGAAESLLAITNCVVVLGFRDALGASRGGSAASAAAAAKANVYRRAAYALGGVAGLSAVAVAVGGDASVHTAWLGGVGNLPSGLWADEPANALSIPTWAIHTSSLVEWLVAMGLAWRYAEESGQRRWKGVTWGMLPLHTSGIVACTYHLFYNTPIIAWCVPLQAGMTCVGNTTLALACLRLALASGWTWQMGKDEAAALLATVSDDVAKLLRTSGAPPTPRPTPPNDSTRGSSADEATAATPAALRGWEDLGDAWAENSDAVFLLKLAALSASLAYLVKYAPALLPHPVTAAWAELPEEVVSAVALSVIVIPTALNCAKWVQRSREDAEFVGDF